MSLPRLTEEALYEQTAQWLNLKHPELVYHYDLSGLWTPSHRLRNLYGRLNKRAWPDLFIARHGVIQRTSPGTNPWGGSTATQVYMGLFIEQKREGTRLKKRDGEWVNDHIAEQALVLQSLRTQGYAAEFAVGLDETINVIEKYLGENN